MNMFNAIINVNFLAIVPHFDYSLINLAKFEESIR
jgi:hypothetical protein